MPKLEELTASERGVLADYWRYRGAGEMGAAGFFLHLLDDLRILGARRPIVELAERARRDEAKHGIWGRDWAVFFGHPDTSDPVASRTRQLTFPRATDRGNRLLRVAFCAMTETVGCHLLSDIRPCIAQPLRRLNREHLADELVHSRVGWGHLSTLDGSDKAVVARSLPLLFRLLPLACCEGPEDEQYAHLIPFGYLTPSVLHRARRRAMAEVILPGLVHLEIIPSAAGFSLDGLPTRRRAG